MRDYLLQFRRALQCAGRLHAYAWAPKSGGDTALQVAHQRRVRGIIERSADA